MHHDLSADAVERDTDASRAGFRSSLAHPDSIRRSPHRRPQFHDLRARQIHASRRRPSGRRIAEYVSLALSHHRMAEESRRTAALRERAANLQMLDGLLKTLSGVLDVREVFDRVSDIAQKVLKHDAISIAELIDNGERVRLYACRGLSDLPQPYEIPVPNRKLVTDPWDFVLDGRCAGGPGLCAGPWRSGGHALDAVRADSCRGTPAHELELLCEGGRPVRARGRPRRPAHRRSHGARDVASAAGRGGAPRRGAAIENRRMRDAG